jgi:hypothetical protein
MISLLYVYTHFSCLAAADPPQEQRADATDDDHDPDRPMELWAGASDIPARHDRDDHRGAGPGMMTRMQLIPDRGTGTYPNGPPVGPARDTCVRVGRTDW